MVATCRSDEAPLDRRVADWLAHVRGQDAVEEIGLGPLSRVEVAEQIAGLVGGPPPRRLVDDLYARGEGNPFFTEQLVAAALTGSAGGGLSAPAGLPERLAELLVARPRLGGGGGGWGRPGQERGTGCAGAADGVGCSVGVGSGGCDGAAGGGAVGPDRLRADVRGPEWRIHAG